MQIDPGSQQLEVTVPGGTLAAQRLGDGEVALLLHGGPGMSDYLGELAAELGGSGVATLRYQQRGVPPSTLEGPFDVERHAADAVAVLDAAGVGRAWVVGHSWGGYLALQVATRFPERVCGVLAIGTLGAIGDGGAAQLGPNIVSRLDDAARAELAEIEAREEAGTATEEDALRGFALAWPGYFADPTNAPAFPPDIQLSEPGHVETVASIERDAEHVASAVTRCAVPVSVLPGVGHFAWLEQPGSAAGAFAALCEMT